MQKKLKIGIIGAGGICQKAHAPGYQKMDNVEIVGVCDLIEEKAIKASNEYGGKAITDYKIILNDPEIDAISICTPNYCHSKIAIFVVCLAFFRFRRKVQYVTAPKKMPKTGKKKSPEGLFLRRVRDSNP